MLLPDSFLFSLIKYVELGDNVYGLAIQFPVDQGKDIEKLRV